MDNMILKKRTIAVFIITIVTMFAEIYFGILTNSMALTADGFHMGTHAFAFLVTLVACIFASKYREKEQKFNALGGYTSALLLGFTSFGIVYESIERFIHPLIISFQEAIFVAVIGLVVNLLCIAIMHGYHIHIDEHCHCDEEHEENLNYKAAYMHILADALTSILAIAALIFGKYFGLTILDSVIGILAGIIIAKWALNLLMTSSKKLLS